MSWSTSASGTSRLGTTRTNPHAGGENAFTVSTRLPGRNIFACDELQTLVGTNVIIVELAQVLETGRRYGLDFAGIAQQPNLGNNRIRNQETEVIAFEQIDPRAVEWCEAVGFDGDAIRALPPGSYLARNLKSGGTAAGRVF